jgi:methylglutaconyl-CoA hydratase
MISLSLFPLEQVAYRGEAMRLDVLAHGVLRLSLARPRARNAINGAMIAESECIFAWMDAHAAEARVLLLQGEGEVFCAGADLTYMRAMAGAPEKENLADAKRLGGLFRRIAGSPIPVVCHVQGAALGGGLGLVACSDYAVAQGSAVFAMPEVRLGLIAGVIGPYVVRKLGLARAAPLMQTGTRISAREALQAGLVQRVVEPTEDAEDVLSQALFSFLQGGPKAVRRTRELLRILAPLPDPNTADTAARIIAQVRASDEARLGLEARAAKSQPPWVKDIP